jgi:CPA2 family monovalent cation:H+ antiporter-2
LLLTGGLVALLFGFLRQPVIVGYLLAGFLIGPNFGYFPRVTEADGIRLWGEIGVLFLLFSLGLEFSFKKLVSMGPASLVAASIEVFGLFALGSSVAQWLGYDSKAALFFGAMLAISSTTVLLRAFTETGTRSARFAENVLGILIVEDLYAVLLLVFLASVSLPTGGVGAVSGTEAVFGTLFRFGFFLIVVFVVGISFLPGLIRRAQRVLSDEMRLVLSLGLCFMTVVLASNLGFSPTLGAFVMGSLLAGTREAKKIEKLIIQEKISYLKEAKETMSEEKNFNLGDKVVCREKHPDCDSPNWVKDMDRIVGVVGTVVGLTPYIRVKYCKVYGEPSPIEWSLHRDWLDYALTPTQNKMTSPADTAQATAQARSPTT